MNPSVLISFVLPVYNMEKFLSNSLSSLCGQTMQEIEIICVDDGSTDKSLEILREFQQKDWRIQIYVNTEESSGAAIPRNLGLSKVTGDYVLVVDSDDTFHPTLAEKVYQKALATNADIILFDVEKFHSDTGEKIPTNQFLNPALLPEQEVFSPMEVADRLFLLGDGVAWNKLIRFSLIQENQLSFFPVHVVDDMNFTFSALVLAKTISVVDEKLLFYRVGNGASQMSNLHRDPLTPVKVLGKLREFLYKHELFSCYEKTYLERGIGLCMFYFDGLQKKEDFSTLYYEIQSVGEDVLGFYRNRLFLVENLLKKQWIEDIYLLSPDEFQEKKKLYGDTVLVSGNSYGIYGYGMRTSLIYDKIKDHGGHCVAIADSSLEKQGQIFQGLTVVPPQGLTEASLDVVCISSPNYYEEMKKMVLSLGFLEEQIVLL